MTTLSIKVSSHDSKAGDLPAREIEVTHLAAREICARELELPHTKTPGIILLIPQSDSFSLSIGSQVTLLVPGLAYLFSGVEQCTIISPVSDDDEEESDPPVLMIELNAMLDKTVRLQELLTLPSGLKPAESEEAEQLYRRLTNNRSSLILPGGQGDFMQHMIAGRLVFLLLSSAGLRQGQKTATAEDDKLVKLKEILMSRLTTNPSMDGIARSLGMSRAVFYRWATPLLGDSPATYMRKLRLERSQDLLRNTSLTIDEIAGRTGFCSRDHLSKQFKTQYGATPARIRQAAKRGVSIDAAEKVAALIRNHRFRQAVALCDKAVKRAKEPGERDRLVYQKACCLHVLGSPEEAVEIWSAMEQTTWAYDAGKKLCDHYFQIHNYEKATQTLARLFLKADKEQQRELIWRWKHRVSELISRTEYQELHRYIEIRKDLFPDDQRSMSLAADVLGKLGRPREIPEQCHALKGRCFIALRQCGLYREAIERYGGDVNEYTLVFTLLQAGQYKEVLSSGIDHPEIMATALTRLGRPEEAIERYSDHCQEAYLSLGRYQDVINRWSEPSMSHIWALHAMSRTLELRNFPSHYRWLSSLAQFFSAPETLLTGKKRQDNDLYFRALIWQALKHLAANETTQAETCLKELPLLRKTVVWWDARGVCEVLLTTVVRGLAGDREVMLAELKTIQQKDKFLDWQKLWHDAAFLLGTIDEQAFLSQPCQAFVQVRLDLVKAFATDLQGETAQAVHAYQALLPSDHFRLRLLREPELRQFITWRLRTLG